MFHFKDVISPNFFWLRKVECCYETFVNTEEIAALTLSLPTNTPAYNHTINDDGFSVVQVDFVYISDQGLTLLLFSIFTCWDLRLDSL